MNNSNGVGAVAKPTNPDSLLPPHSIEAEEAVLGAILTNSESIYKVQFLDSDSFFILRNSWVWEAMYYLAANGLAIDYLTVSDRLRNQNRLEEIGGAAYLMYLINNTPTHLHADAYGQVVLRDAVRRKLVGLASEIVQSARSAENEIQEILSQYQTRLTELAGVLNPTKYADESVGAEALVIAEEIEGGNEDLQVYPTGLQGLDITLKGGLRRGTQNIIAGRMAHGKSILLKQIALWLANHSETITQLDSFTSLERTQERKLRVVYFQLESTRKSVTRRMLSEVTGYNTDYLDSQLIPPDPKCIQCDGTGLKTNGDRCHCFEGYGEAYRSRVKKGAAKLASLDLDIVVGTQTHQSFKNEVLRRHLERPIDVVVYDHLHRTIPMPGENNQLTIATTVATGTNLAIDLNLIMLMGAQLNRNAAVDTNTAQTRRPQIQHMEWSDKIGQEADNILAVARDYDASGAMSNDTKLWHLKLREGATQNPYLPLEFNPNQANFQPKTFT